MVVWDQVEEKLITDQPLHRIKMILWKGHCSVHEKFTVQNIEETRKRDRDIQILVHPECTHEVVRASDLAGSTKFIIDTIKQAPAGSKWAIGTEMNLVKRIIDQHLG